MIKQFGFLFSLVFANTIMPTNPELGQNVSNINDSERMTFDSVVFSKNMAMLPEEFCKNVIESAPAELKAKINVLLVAKKDDNILRKIVLYGPPGTGKTTLARVILQQMNIPYLFVKAPSLANEYRNSGAAGLSRIAKVAVALKAAVIIDELDCVSKNTGSDKKSPEDNTPKALGLFIDELISHKTLFIGTANSIKDMPEALQSRLKGALFNLPIANRVSSKVQIINQCLKGRLVDSQEIILSFAKQFNEISTRDIETIVNLAYESAYLRNSSKPVIGYNDLKAAFDRLKKADEALKNENSNDSSITFGGVVQGTSLLLDLGKFVLALKGHGNPHFPKQTSRIAPNPRPYRNYLTNNIR